MHVFVVKICNAMTGETSEVEIAGTCQVDVTRRVTSGPNYALAVQRKNPGRKVNGHAKPTARPVAAAPDPDITNQEPQPAVTADETSNPVEWEADPLAAAPRGEQLDLALGS